MARKYLRRTSDNVIVGGSSREHPSWARMAGHDVQDGPGGVEKTGADMGGTDANGYSYWSWKIEGDPLVWVAIDTAGKDAEKLVQSRARRQVKISALQAEAVNNGNAYFTGNAITAIKDNAAARKTACETERDAHETNWDSLWVPGTNP